MVKPPSELGGEQVLRFALIDQAVSATGATTHRLAEIVDGEIVPGETMGEFAALAIVGDSDSGYFLLCLDESCSGLASSRGAAQICTSGTPPVSSTPRA